MSAAASDAGAGRRIHAVISDFGGVLTNHLVEAFAAFQNESGISAEQLGRGMQRVAERDGEYPLYRLERGEVSEPDFLEDLSWGLEEELGHRPVLHAFREIYFKALHANEPMLELMRELRGRGYRMAILTNNVREWEEHWRAKLPIDEIFELVVDSAWVGMRKPEPEIYQLTCERSGRSRSRALPVRRRQRAQRGGRPPSSECAPSSSSPMSRRYRRFALRSSSARCRCRACPARRSRALRKQAARAPVRRATEALCRASPLL